jgi:predicted phosphodiesterase
MAFRPRLTETEFSWWQLKKFYEKKLYRVLLKSDEHGWLTDLSVQRCINRVLQRNHFDEVALLGDLGDWPYISRHEKKLYDDGILAGYSEVGEAQYIREQILAPLRNSTKAKIRFIPGNHDERITKPQLLSKGQLARLAILHKNYESTELGKILGFDEYGIEWDGRDSLDWFNGKFTGVHGLSLAKNAPEKNIYEYMGSGASGHTHRLQYKPITNRHNPYVWVEVGCGRVRTEVEYFPTGRIPDWQHGFAELTFYEHCGEMFFSVHPIQIIEGRCLYNGVLYDGNYKK